MFKKANEFESWKRMIISYTQEACITQILDNYKDQFGKKSLSPNDYAHLGVSMLMDKEARSVPEISKSFFLMGAAHGLVQKTFYDDTNEAVYIGRCLAMLLTQYPLNKDNHDTILKATALAYLYLSYSLEMDSRTAPDVYMLRAVLLKDHRSPQIFNEILNGIGPFSLLGWRMDLLLISDCSLAYKFNKSNPAFQEMLLMAENLHEDLEDMSIEGKDADDYNLEELVKIGETRNGIVYRTLKNRHKDGAYDLTIEELLSINK